MTASYIYVENFYSIRVMYLLILSRVLAISIEMEFYVGYLYRELIINDLVIS